MMLLLLSLTFLIGGVFTESSGGDKELFFNETRDWSSDIENVFERLTNERRTKRDTMVEYKYDGKVNMCFFCDPNCQKSIPEQQTPEEHFSAIVNKTNQMWSTLDIGVDFELQTKQVFALNFVLPIRQYIGSRTTGNNAVKNLGDNFLHGIFKRAQKFGCESLFLIDPLTSPNVFDGVESMAYQGSMCSDKSYGLIRLRDSVDDMAAYVAHEVAHQMGIFNDEGAVDVAYLPHIDTINYYFGAEAWDALEKACSDPASSCEDGAGACVMNANPLMNGVPSRFSGCSKEQLRMVYRLTSKWPSLYKYKCY